MDLKYRPLSDVNGKITEILLSAPHANKNEDLRRTYGGVFDAFDGSVFCIIITDLSPDSFPEANTEGFAPYLPHKRLFLISPDYQSGVDRKKPTEYIQDPFTILEWENGSPIFLEPYYFGKDSRSYDAHVAEQVSAHAGYFMKSTKYFFEGGNLATDGNFLMIGKDSLMENLKYYYGESSVRTESPKDIENLSAELASTFGVKHVIWVGMKASNSLNSPGLRQGRYGFQPFFHLDYFLTLGGKTRDGAELVFMAEIQKEDLKRLPASKIDDWKKVGKMLKETKRNLERHHKIHPGPRFKVQTVPMGFRVDSSGHVWPLSFNNCLMENYYPVKVAYLPRYQVDGDQPTEEYLKSLHKRVEQKFEEAGYSCKFVKGDFYQMASAYASLHCVAKVTKRSYR